ncbi:MAG: Zn-ribbon domain-containing OB-fold protein [Nocardioides sp.]
MSDALNTHVVIPGMWRLDFHHAAGPAASRFLTTLRDRGVLTASPCPSCGRIRVPPRDFCEDCFVATSDQWLDVGPHAVIEAATIGYSSFPGYPEPPYALVYARPDGADTAIGNLLYGIDLADSHVALERMHIGASVSAVFADERSGLVTDFHWALDDKVCKI